MLGGAVARKGPDDVGEDFVDGARAFPRDIGLFRISPRRASPQFRQAIRPHFHNPSSTEGFNQQSNEPHIPQCRTEIRAAAKIRTDTSRRLMFSSFGAG